MRKLPAEPVFYILSGVTTLANTVMFTVTTVYYFTAVSLNPLQLVLVGTVLETTAFLFEVPTGVVADTVSRRVSVILGMFVLGAGFVLVGAIPLFATVLLGQVVTGIGYTFLSGALEAWLADEVGEANLAKVYLRSGQIDRGVGLAGTLVSVGLASVHLQLPIVLGGGIYLLLGLILVLVMPESVFQPLPRQGRTTWGKMIHTFGTGARVVRRSPVLLTLLGVNAIVGAASEGFDRLGDAHLLANFTFPALGDLKPVVWFGILNFSGGIFSLATTEVFRRLLETTGRHPNATARVLLALNSLATVSVVAFALTDSFPLALGALLLKSAVGALTNPLYNAWLVQHVEPKVRATVLSMMGQTNALGQVVGGPAVGYVGNALSLRAALVLAGVLLTPSSLLYASTLHRRSSSEYAIPILEDQAQ